MDKVRNITDFNQSFVAGYREIPQWVRSLELVYLSTVMVFGIPGNGLIILVQLKNKSKSSTDCLVLTMAGFDFICASFNAVLQVIKNTRVVWRFIASSFLCQLFIFLSFMTGGSTTLLMAGIAVDRYIKTCRPLNTFYSTKKAKHLCVVISCASILLAIPAVPVFRLDQYGECQPYYPLIQILKGWQTFLVTMTTGVFFIISVSYSCVVLTLRKRHREQVRIKMALVSGTRGQERRRSPIRRTLEDRNKVYPEGTVSGAPKTTNTTTLSHSVANKTTTSGFQTVCKMNATNGGTPETASRCSDNKVRDDMRINRLNTENPPSANRFATQGNKEKMGSANRISALFKRYRKTTVIRALVLQEQAMNRTTFIMIMITVIYMITHGLNWYIVVQDTHSEFIYISRYISLSSIMINSITNPLFFFCMSSKFRTNAKKVICKPKHI